MEKYVKLSNVENMLTNAQIITDGENCGYCTDDISLYEIPTEDVAPVIHAKRIKTRKHRWKRDTDGSIDFLAWDMEFHSGPACIECGKIFCENCESVRDKVNGVKNALEEETCIERTVCSICGRNVSDDALYCNCGAKLDKEVS